MIEIGDNLKDVLKALLGALTTVLIIFALFGNPFRRKQ